jgi:DNA-binding NarL/FixJ family response regulator
MSAEDVVLVVDDDRMIRTLLQNVLSAAPRFRTVAAADGEEGLLRAWELGPTLVLADLLMPGMDGATFCRLLRAHPRSADARVVALSAADPRTDRAVALRAQCVAWVGKPFEVGELLRVVDRWLPAAAGGPTARPPSGPSSWGPLTPREREVAALVARGLSNRRIAQELTLERGTVANHVRHVLLKLALDSRTQLGVWVARDTQRRVAAGLD